MKPQVDSCAALDALLLDYAYGELEGAPRRKVEDHLSSCARCRTALMAVAETRHAMAALTPEPVPESGLDSLLAYAEQAARQRAAERPKPSLWRWLVPALSLAGVSAAVLLVVARSDNAAERLAPATAAPSGHAAKLALMPARPEPSVASPAAVPAVVPSTVALAVDGAKSAGAGGLAKAEPAPEKAAESYHVAPAKKADEHFGDLDKVRKAAPARVVDSPAAGESQPVALEEKKALAADEDPQSGMRERSARDEVRHTLAKDSAEKEAPGGVKGQAIGSKNYARAPFQNPVLGAPADDEARSQGVRTAEVMSNVGIAAQQPKPDVSAAPPAPPAVAPAKPAAASPPAETKAAGAMAKAKSEAADGYLGQDRDRAPASDSPDQLLQRAADWSAKGDYSGAEALYAQFLARFPAHPRAPEAALSRAAVLERLGRASDAAAQRVELARRWPDSKEAQATRGAAGPAAGPAAKRAVSAPAHEEMDKAAPADAVR